MAEMSGDEAMLTAFAEGMDIHQATAARVFGVAPDQVTREMRSKAKMVNFGIIYSISAFGLSQRLGIPRTEAKELIEQYFLRFPGIRSYMDDTLAFARANGYVKTIMGRRRYLKDINSRNFTIRGIAEREAINAPVQGSAADLIKLAMINIHRRINESGLLSRMTLQVHDELVFEMHRSEEAILLPLIREEMTSALQTKVPLVVEIGQGTDWLSAH
jgi:DNA polymerase-1